MKVRCQCESPGGHRVVHPMREQVGGVIKGPADAKTRKRENVFFSLERGGPSVFGWWWKVECCMSEQRNDWDMLLFVDIKEVICRIYSSQIPEKFCNPETKACSP